MGWERKRGKLADFNRLLLNMGETAYTTQVGDASILPDIKYVITLDADTSLPQGSANRLIATLAHPLNHAEFSADGRSVVAGYTVLQPRVAIKPTSANRSLFSQIFAGNAGFDLYSFAVSDVYQDLFGEGSYVGKGIYDVAAFERSLAGQVRQNTLLSHDLFEGIYGRAALVTDIVLYEEYPSRYMVYARRLRRWIRGDWQLLPWLFPIVHTKNGMAPNRLSIINLWKVFDNLRRSLLPPTLLALLAAGWLFLPGSPLVWTVLVLLPSGLPIAVQTMQNVSQLRSERDLVPARAQPLDVQTNSQTNPAPINTLGACHYFSAIRSAAYVGRDLDYADPLADCAQKPAAMDNCGEYSPLVWIERALRNLERNGCIFDFHRFVGDDYCHCQSNCFMGGVALVDCMASCSTNRLFY